MESLFFTAARSRAGNGSGSHHVVHKQRSAACSARSSPIRKSTCAGPACCRRSSEPAGSFQAQIATQPAQLAPQWVFGSPRAFWVHVGPRSYEFMVGTHSQPSGARPASTGSERAPFFWPTTKLLFWLAKLAPGSYSAAGYSSGDNAQLRVTAAGGQLPGAVPRPAHRISGR